MEQLKREKREAKAAKKRKVNTRDKIVRFLIVCEGVCTEPNYFKALVKDRYSEVRSEEIMGAGRSTCALVKKTDEIKTLLETQRQLPFDRVWVVFDKDDFLDFNEAIALANKLGFHSAWTNEAFELWYLLHFTYIDTGVGRDDYIKKLEAEIRKHKSQKKFQYRKNDTEIYSLLKKYGDVTLAKEYALRLRKKFIGSQDFKSHIPCTTVDLLVEELENPEALFRLSRKGKDVYLY